MPPTLVNPFNFETPANRWSFTDREEMLPRLQRLMNERGRRALLHGRRRMGKTSLLHQAARTAKTRWLFVDLSTAADLNEVARKLLAQVPEPEPPLADRVLRVLRKYVKLSFQAGKFVVGELRDPAGPDLATLEQVLDFIDERAAIDDTGATIGMDEFQDIRALAGPRAEWSLRGIMQRHEHVNYLLSGSDHRLVKWMTEPKAAFYKQLELVSVGPIDPGLLAEWVDDRARRGGLAGAELGAAVVAAAGPCTGDVVRLAKSAFQFAAEGRKGEVVGTALDEIALGELDGECVERWRGLGQPQRVMLRAVAARRFPLYAAETLRRYGIRSASTASTAVKALLDREILVREVGEIAFDSPFFRRWVEATAGPG